MNIIDWIVLCGTLAFIVGYGVWKTRGSKDIGDFLLADKSMKWWTICLSIMATQASAITFLSTPGQAYQDGMGFIQFYLGLPIAMIIISVVVVPLFAKLNVYTAYEFLEGRFDLKTRSLAAVLFLIQRGLAAGITIYAPSIILSVVLGWNLNLTNLFMGGLVIIYTVSGGTKAVSVTQTQQMAVMMSGMIIAGFVVISLLPKDISLTESVQVAGEMGKMNLLNFSFDVKQRYNIWSGIIGSLFLFLSYFGTDQSQVARYLSGKSVTESRLGLLFNGILKIPMQFIILFIGVMVFVFYQFNQPPVFFNNYELKKANQTSFQPAIQELENKHKELFTEKKEKVSLLIAALRENDEEKIKSIRHEVHKLQKEHGLLQDSLKKIIKKASPDSEIKDTDYVFITFVMNHLPVGLIGLLMAVIFCAAMSSTASELNALASTTVVDIYKRSVNEQGSDHHYLSASRWFTIMWGALAIGFAMAASLFENLIQLVNLIGSIFYGTILGIFAVAFFFKYIRGHAVFIAALIAETIVIALYIRDVISFLWFNLIGCVAVILFGLVIEFILRSSNKKSIT